jgi:hypothetical protein
VKRKQGVGKNEKITLTAAILFLLFATSASAFDYFTDRMNFPPSGSRTHSQTITFNGNFTATLPTGFSLSSYSEAPVIIGSNMTWFSNTTKTVNYTLSSPASCTSGTRYYSSLYQNNVLQGNFVYVCLPDDKIVDYKMEYGHGDANYLTENCISGEQAVLFNLVRVFNIGSYLTPNEPAHNATISCFFENYPVRTYGNIEVVQANDTINGTFFWDKIDTGYWFRIGVLSQEVFGKSVGDSYSVRCNWLTYRFSHEQVQAGFTNQTFYIRSMTPFLVTYQQNPSNPEQNIYLITNVDQCSAYSLDITRILNGAMQTEHFTRIMPNETIKVLGENNVTVSNLSIYFVPSWYANSRNPKYYLQSFSVNYPPVLSQIGTHIIYVNQTFTYQAVAYDPNNDTLTFFDNTTLFDINSSTGMINFTPNSTQIGNYSINITVTDGIYNVSKIMTLIVYAEPFCGDSICGSGESCSSCPADCGSCPPSCPPCICGGCPTCPLCEYSCPACPSCPSVSCPPAVCPAMNLTCPEINITQPVCPECNLTCPECPTIERPVLIVEAQKEQINYKDFNMIGVGQAYGIFGLGKGAVTLSRAVLLAVILTATVLKLLSYIGYEKAFTLLRLWYGRRNK